MSVFYVMPPRPFVGDRFADFLQTLFPGLAWDSSDRASLVELLGSTTEREDVFVIYRDDLARGEGMVRALVDRFGAEVGDEVIEVHPGSRLGEITTRRWRIEAETTSPQRGQSMPLPALRAG